MKHVLRRNQVIELDSNKLKTTKLKKLFKEVEI